MNATPIPPDSTALPDPSTRPRLRGAVPLAAFIATIPFVAWLRLGITNERAGGIALVYGFGLLLLFGVSALYHFRTWSRGGYELMRKFDHLTIFVFIATSYTPIGLLGVGGERGTWLVRTSWLFTVLGALQSFLWPRAPRWLRSTTYLVMGWTGIFAVAPIAHRVGLIPAAMLVAGGVVYSLGAVIYARKRPDPVPDVFGYHEVFHSLVVVACGMLCICIRACLSVT